MPFNSFRVGLLIVVGVVTFARCSTAQPYNVIWARQYGTEEVDWSYAISGDAAGSTYMVGGTSSSLFGPHAGEEDAFVIKHDACGNEMWSRQFGSPAFDRATGAAMTQAGGVYVVGRSPGQVGGPILGGVDIFVFKYDAVGNLLWSKQLGTTAGESNARAFSDAQDNLYLTGGTRGDLGGPHSGNADAFVMKLDGNGNVVWSKQVGTPTLDLGVGAATDSTGNVLLAGGTEGNLAGPNAGSADVFLAKYDPSGNQIWIRQTGTTEADVANDFALDSSGNAYICGQTEGSFFAPNAGGRDIFLIKYDADGDLLWGWQTGSVGTDTGYAVAVDSMGRAYVAARFFEDVALFRLDAAGNLIAVDTFNPPENDVPQAVHVDSAGNAYMSGATRGDLGGPNAGIYDAFLVKLGTANCYADCDKSHTLDVFDFLCFQDAFVSLDPSADCNCDMELDIDDYLCFQDAFAAGCP